MKRTVLYSSLGWDIIPNTTLALRLVPEVPFPFTTFTTFGTFEILLAKKFVGTFTTFARKLARLGAKEGCTIKKCKKSCKNHANSRKTQGNTGNSTQASPGGAYCYMLYPGAVRGRLLAVVEWGRVFTPADRKTRQRGAQRLRASRRKNTPVSCRGFLVCGALAGFLRPVTIQAG